MLPLNVIATTLLALGSLLQPTSALLPITIKGNRFIKPALDSESGSVFFINGVDYQPGGSSGYSYEMTADVLTDPEVCARDATLIQNLGVNTIRVYTIDPDLNHDECMTIFNNAGIYVILDVNSPLGGESLNRDDPESTYNAWYLSRVFKVIESFRHYSNVIGFFLGNEVINDEKSASLDPRFLRAITRDAKEYIANRLAEDEDSRDIFVGYSAADVVELRMPTFEYMTCQLDGNHNESMSAIDFFGLNSYEWCSGVNDWESSGYENLVDEYTNSSVPVFFSEYGCNKQMPRTFEEVSEGVFDGLLNVLDGGLIYEYSEEASNYGLVDISDSDSVILKGDYFNLKSQISESKIPFINETKVEDYEAPKCNAKLIEQYDDYFEANFTLPLANKDTRYMIDNGVDVQHKGQFVDVDEYLNLYISGASTSGNMTKAAFIVGTDSESSTTEIYLTIDPTNLINNKSDKSPKTTTSSSSTAVVSTTAATTSSVSSISSHSKNNVGKLDASLWSGFAGVVLALL
ncbi:hypothetical protein CANINC_003982 [Pichia inconspicua]|uniref:1,3-beta-glucanosyltransferase n=1 Tax=Pichia inconspicua TaxID=52247 RepID=A0A4T0WXB8_9ASCO|nr:hypothetical protein CANINC_003982 [[Candida] inconspicua]